VPGLPNKGLQATGNSLRSFFAPTVARACSRWFGCAGTNRHEVKEWKSPTVQVEPPTLAPSQARASVTEPVKR
jgi:hypothetical protein